MPNMNMLISRKANNCCHKRARPVLAMHQIVLPCKGFKPRWSRVLKHVHGRQGSKYTGETVGQIMKRLLVLKLAGFIWKLVLLHISRAQLISLITCSFRSVKQMTQVSHLGVRSWFSHYVQIIYRTTIRCALVIHLIVIGPYSICSSRLVEHPPDTLFHS